MKEDKSDGNDNGLYRPFISSRKFFDRVFFLEELATENGVGFLFSLVFIKAWPIPKILVLEIAKLFSAILGNAAVKWAALGVTQRRNETIAEHRPEVILQ